MYRESNGRERTIKTFFRRSFTMLPCVVKNRERFFLVIFYSFLEVSKYGVLASSMNINININNHSGFYSNSLQVA